MGVRVGLAGAGVFGRFHGLKLKADPGADLCGVFDVDQTRADALGAELGCPGFSDLDAVLERIVSVPRGMSVSRPPSLPSPAQRLSINREDDEARRSIRWRQTKHQESPS